MSEENAYELPAVSLAKERRYRDELNFAEFPLASLSDTVPEGQKTLVFTDTIFDRSLQAQVPRKLTITASDEYGLPTAQDDEVILGLIQLTSKQGFSDRRVHFTRRELIKELNWRDESKSYGRVAKSLKRWLGVTLYYEKAWWSNEEKCWVDESFHVLDQVTIFDKERIMRRVKSLPGDPKAGLSSFLWNEVVFASFQAGYLKQLDFEFYKSLHSQIAKRMYRFLDKRFYRRARLEFDLHQFAFAKVGVSRKCHTGEIKRRLMPAISELEAAGFLEALSSKERFVRRARGEWGIVFVRAKTGAKPARAEMTDNPLIAELTSHGVSTRAAAALVRDYPASTISEKIRLVGWLKDRADARISKNPAGFLVKAIREDYPLPAEFKAQLAAERTGRMERSEWQEKDTTTQVTHAERSDDEKRRAIDGYWKSLSPEEQGVLEDEALRAADKFLRTQYETRKERGGTLFEAARTAILEREIKRRLSLPQAA